MNRQCKSALTLRGILFILVASVCFSLIFFECNSPLGPSIGSDNAMYLTMGTAIARGYAPYSDIFDHKGPLLFILETIPQALSGGYSTLAVFIQEWLFLFACLIILHRICADAGCKTPWLVLLIYLALNAPLVSGGNLSELYTNLFTLAGLFLILRVFDRGGLPGARSLFLHAGGIGVMVMLCFMTRANNMLVLCCAVLGLTLALAIQRRPGAIGVCAGGFLLGSLAAAAPILLWLRHYGALGDAFYGAIIHNMMYAETDGIGRVTKLLHSSYGHLAMFIAAVACAGALLHGLHTRRFCVSLALIAGAAGAGIGAFISHKYYDHYLMLGTPTAAVGAALILSTLSSSVKARRTLAAITAAACCATLCVFGSQAYDRRSADFSAMEQFTADAQALYAQVPEDERGSFMAYRVEPKWYVATGALPCMRFYFLQEILADADPRVMDEIVDTFETDPPQWLVIYYNRAFSPPYDPRVAEIFETRYAFVDAQGEYQLLRLIREDRP